MTTQQAQASAEAQKPEGQESKEEAPKAERTFTEAEVQARVGRLESRYQKREAALNTQVKTLSDAVQQSQAQLSELELNRTYGTDEEAKAAAKRIKEQGADLDRRRSELTATEQRLNTMARDTTKKVTSAKYGIPEEDLDEYETPREMEQAGRLYQLERAQAEKEQAKKAPPAKPESTPRRRGYESSEPRGGSTVPLHLIKDPKEFLAEVNRQARETAQRTGRG